MNTFNSIARQVSAFDAAAFTSKSAAQESKSERLATIYAVVRPILVVIAGIPLIPKAWRAALRIFITTVDEVWSFVYGKDRNIPKAIRESTPFTVGSIWTWTCIDSDSKLMLSLL